MKSEIKILGCHMDSYYLGNTTVCLFVETDSDIVEEPTVISTTSNSCQQTK